MAFITDTRVGGISLAGRLATVRANWTETAQKRKTYNTTLAELGALSNRDLADLGLSRGQIKSVAFEAAYGS